MCPPARFYIYIKCIKIKYINIKLGAKRILDWIWKLRQFFKTIKRVDILNFGRWRNFCSHVLDPKYDADSLSLKTLWNASTKIFDKCLRWKYVFSLNLDMSFIISGDIPLAALFILIIRLWILLCCMETKLTFDSKFLKMWMFIIINNSWATFMEKTSLFGQRTSVKNWNDRSIIEMSFKISIHQNVFFK